MINQSLSWKARRKIHWTHLDGIRNEKMCESKSHAYHPERDRDIVNVQFEEFFQPFEGVDHEIERERCQDHHDRGQEEISIDRSPVRMTGREYYSERDVLENAHGEHSIIVLALKRLFVCLAGDIRSVPGIIMEHERWSQLS